METLRTPTETANFNKYVVELCGNCKEECNLKCSKCNIASYCSRSCQKANWKEHQILWKCSFSKDEENDSSTSPVLLEDRNKIKFGEMLNAQIILTYTFLAENLMFGNNDDEIEEYLKIQSNQFKDAGFPLHVSYICKQLLDKTIFEHYDGAVYFHSSCFGEEDVIFDGHFPLQNPVKIAEGSGTRELTPRKLINAITNGVTIMTEDDLAQYTTNDLRPLFNCAEHKDLHGFQLYQFKDGVLISIVCF